MISRELKLELEEYIPTEDDPIQSTPIDDELYQSYGLANSQLMDGGYFIKIPINRVEELISDNEELMDHNFKLGDHIKEQQKMIQTFSSQMNRLQAEAKESTARRRLLESHDESLTKERNDLLDQNEAQHSRLMVCIRDNKYLTEELAALNTMFRGPCDVSEELDLLADTLRVQRDTLAKLRALADILGRQQELAERPDSLIWEIQKQCDINEELKRQLESFQRRGGPVKQLEKTKGTCARLRMKWVNLRLEAERLYADQEHIAENEVGISDGLVTETWTELVCAIRRLAAKASIDKQQFIAPTREQSETFGKLIPQFRKYFTAHTPVLFEAAIWAHLCQFVVHPTMIWTSRGGQFVNSVFGKLECMYLENK